MPTHRFIYMPSGDLWLASSVNDRLPLQLLTDRNGKPVLDDKGEPIFIKLSKWLGQHRPVEQMTWAPGEALLIYHRLIVGDGWINHPGAIVFNRYLPPTITPGNAVLAGPWLDHVRLVYPNDAEHIIKCLAHRRQRPQDKINHALVLGGAMGIGKDALLVPAIEAVGTHNCRDISPKVMMGRFTGFLKP
jgi:hypothetical protein